MISIMTTIQDKTRREEWNECSRLPPWMKSTQDDFSVQTRPDKTRPVGLSVCMPWQHNEQSEETSKQTNHTIQYRKKKININSKQKTIQHPQKRKEKKKKSHSDSDIDLELSCQKIPRKRTKKKKRINTHIPNQTIYIFDKKKKNEQHTSLLPLPNPLITGPSRRIGKGGSGPLSGPATGSRGVSGRRIFLSTSFRWRKDKFNWLIR